MLKLIQPITQRLSTSAEVLASSLSFPADALVVAADEGIEFVVAASDATDHHVTTAGGMKLYVVPGQLGYDVRAFGAVCDASTDSDAAFISAAAVARLTHGSVFVPSGPGFVVKSISFSGITIQGENVSHSTTNAGYFGSIIIHSASATDDLFHSRPAPGDVTYQSPSGWLRNLILIGKRDSNRKNPKTITASSTTLVFRVAVGDLPANDPDNAYLASPYFGTCFFYNDEGRYIGHGEVQSVNRSTGDVTMSESFYSVRTGGTYLEAGFQVCFSEYTTESTTTGVVATVKRWDASRAGYCAIDVSGISIMNRIQDVYVYGFHAAFRKGNQIMNRLENLHVRNCTLGAIWHAYPANGSDDFIGTVVASGNYLPELINGTTSVTAEVGSFQSFGRLSVSLFRIACAAIEAQLLIGFDAKRILVFQNATDTVIRSLIADRSTYQAVLASGASATINVCSVRGVGLAIATGTQDCIANSSSRLSIGQLVSASLGSRFGRNLIRHSDANAKTTVFELIDSGGHAGLQAITDLSRASFSNGPYLTVDGSPITEAILPAKIGEMVQDTTNNIWYLASGLTSSDWLALTPTS